ncbi:MAG: TonB-dependent receptor, partial [Bacteroidota bacterium]
YDRLNENRTTIVHQMDIRIDKRYYFQRFSLNLYFDLQNVYNNQTGFPPFLLPEQDDQGNLKIDPNDPSRYVLKFSDNVQPPFFPALGAILEF